MAKLPVFSRSSAHKKPNESMSLVVLIIVSVVFGLFIGISFLTVNITKLHFPSSIVSYIEDKNSGLHPNVWMYQVTVTLIMSIAWRLQVQSFVSCAWCLLLAP